MNSPKKNRYLFISRTLRGGGAERFVSTFTSYLAECGYDVHILLYETHEDDYNVNDKVKKHILPFEPISIKGKIGRIIDIKKAISDINPDIIIPFVDTVVTGSFIANLFIGKKFIHTVRVSPWHEKQIGSKLSNFLRSVIAWRCDAIMLQTAEQGDFFPDSYKPKEYIVPNPIPIKYNKIKKIEYKTEYETIVLTARLEKQKNIPLLILAFNEVVKKRKMKIQLHIYGEGVERDNLQALIDNLGIGHVCKLMGRTNNVDEVLQHADLYVLTSDFEGMPNALMEAMAVGVPCISTSCRTGPRDLIDDNKTGILFEVKNQDQLEEKLSWALDNTARMNEIGRCGREHIINNFQLNNTLEKFNSMVEAML